MPNVLIRDLSDEVHARLKERAAAEGLSLQSFLARELEAVAALRSSREFTELVERRLLDLGGDDPPVESTLAFLDQARSESTGRPDPPRS